jgi:hypothetical protein
MLIYSKYSHLCESWVFSIVFIKNSARIFNKNIETEIPVRYITFVYSSYLNDDFSPFIGRVTTHPPFSSNQESKTGVTILLLAGVK